MPLLLKPHNPPCQLTAEPPAYSNIDMWSHRGISNMYCKQYPLLHHYLHRVCAMLFPARDSVSYTHRGPKALALNCSGTLQRYGTVGSVAGHLVVAGVSSPPRDPLVLLSLLLGMLILIEADAPAALRCGTARCVAVCLLPRTDTTLVS